MATRPTSSPAAARAGRGEAGWIDGLLRDLQQCQAPLVELLAAHGCHACTDITGFGLLGRLGEMLAHRGRTALQVRLQAAAIPAWPGALALLEQGLASSLAPANAAALALLAGPVRLLEPSGSSDGDGEGMGRQAARRALLIDPQTCGPLLAALPGERAAGALRALQEAGFHQARLIGSVEG